MAFVLSGDTGIVKSPADWKRFNQRWRDYGEYLESLRHRLPTSAFEFATAAWHYDTSDHRSLHDSWLESMTISEPAQGERHEIRPIEIQVRLFGAYHDGHTTLRYREVIAYSLDTPAEFKLPPFGVGHGDWLRDEIRLSERGYVLHEIEFSRGSRWLNRMPKILNRSGKRYQSRRN